MITLQRITTSDQALYAYMEDLMTHSFPPDEYRTLDELRLFTDHKKHFHNNIIMDDDRPVGLFTYWDFDDFYYAEHFAISPSLRNGGYGKAALQYVCEKLNKPIVLEVELPEEEMARRRIAFYARNDFTLWQNEYHQPPYKPGDSFLPMRLMVHGTLNCRNDYEKVRKRIYCDVYNAKTQKPSAGKDGHQAEPR